MKNVILNNPIDGDVFPEIFDYAFPSYDKAEKDRIYNSLKTHIGKQIAVYAFNTDQHTALSATKVVNGLKGLAKLTTEIPFNAVFLGGDEDAYTSPNPIEMPLKVRNALRGADCNVFAIAGNHDASDASYNGNYGYNLKVRANDCRGIMGYSDKTSTNGFWDDDSAKIRFIFLDNMWTNFSANDPSVIACINAAFANFPNGYVAIVVSHVIAKPLSGYEKSLGTTNYNTLINAANNAGVRIIANFCGHEHFDKQVVADDILMINTTCSGQIYTKADFDGVTRTGVAGTVTETAQDIIVIDFTNSRIYMYRWGIGADRVFSFANGSIGVIWQTISGTISTNDADITLSSLNVAVTYGNLTRTSSVSGAGAYNIQWITPEHDWKIQVLNGTNVLYEDVVSVAYADVTKDIVV